MTPPGRSPARNFVPTANARGSPAADHPGMTRPPKSVKVLLVADRRVARTQTTSIPARRYRIARLRLAPGQHGSEAPFEYLKRVYD